MMRNFTWRSWTRAAGAASMLLLPALAVAQEAMQWEVGAGGGYAFSKKVDVRAGAVSGSAGFASNYAVSGLFGNNTYKFVGGEVRYTYRQDALTVSSGGTKATMTGDSHAFHYDVLFHAAPREAVVRPFLAVGGGVKFYRGTGPSQAYQPLSNLILLTHTSELRPLITAGGGIKFRVSRHALIRFDVRDYITPYPNKVLTVFNSKASGWIHDIAFLAGVSTAF
jgi:hypothetical protein